MINEVCCGCPLVCEFRPQAQQSQSGVDEKAIVRVKVDGVRWTLTLGVLYLWFPFQKSPVYIESHQDGFDQFNRIYSVVGKGQHETLKIETTNTTLRTAFNQVIFQRNSIPVGKSAIALVPNYSLQSMTGPELVKNVIPGGVCQLYDVVCEHWCYTANGLVVVGGR